MLGKIAAGAGDPGAARPRRMKLNAIRRNGGIAGVFRRRRYGIKRGLAAFDQRAEIGQRLIARGLADIDDGVSLKDAGSFVRSVNDDFHFSLT